MAHVVLISQGTAVSRVELGVLSITRHEYQGDPPIQTFEIESANLNPVGRTLESYSLTFRVRSHSMHNGTIYVGPGVGFAKVMKHGSQQKLLECDKQFISFFVPLKDVELVRLKLEYTERCQPNAGCVWEDSLDDDEEMKANEEEEKQDVKLAAPASQTPSYQA